MTEKQLKHFYFLHWNLACRSNDWRMEKGRLVGKRSESFGPPDINDIYQAVWKIAAQIANEEHCGVKADHLRHACHRVALGRDKSAKLLTNPECDRVVALFKILRDPDDLDAVLDYLHPENQARKRLLVGIERLAPAAYIEALATERFRGVEDWRTLDLDDLRELAGKLRNRKANWNKNVVQALACPENRPF